MKEFKTTKRDFWSSIKQKWPQKPPPSKTIRLN